MSDKLISTKYEGVYYKELQGLYQGKPNLSYYIMYRSGQKQIKKSVGKKSLKMTAAKASQIRLDILYEIKHGINEHNSKDKIFRELVDMWYNDKKLTISSAKEERQRIEKHAPNIMDKKVMDISSFDIKDMYHQAIGNGLSEQTFKKIFAIYKRVINHSLEHRYIQRAPNVIFNKKIKENKVTESYTDEMINNYIQVINNYHDVTMARIVMLILTTGMRRSEPPKLKWKNYDFTNSTVIIEDAKSGQNETYFLSEKAKEIIESQRAFTQTYIFEDQERQPIKTGKISYHAKNMALKAALPDHFRPLHSLRHRFGTELAKSGLNSFMIQKMMTHKDPKTTQRYIDLANEDILKALNESEKNSNIGNTNTNVDSKLVKIEVDNKKG